MVTRSHGGDAAPCRAPWTRSRWQLAVDAHAEECRQEAQCLGRSTRRRLSGKSSGDQSPGYRWTVVSSSSIGSCSSFGLASAATAVATGAKRGGQCRCEDTDGSKQANLELEYWRGVHTSASPSRGLPLPMTQMDVTDDDKFNDTILIPKEREDEAQEVHRRRSQEQRRDCGYCCCLPFHTHGRIRSVNPCGCPGLYDVCLVSCWCLDTCALRCPVDHDASQFLQCSAGVAAIRCKEGKEHISSHVNVERTERKTRSSA